MSAETLAAKKKQEEKYEAERRSAALSEAINRIITGALIFVVAIVVTFITYNIAINAPRGGRFIVAHGAALYGIVRFFRGLIQWITLNTEEVHE